MNNDFLIDKIREAYKANGYSFFERGDYNLNTGGIRCNNSKADLFDDLRYHVYKWNGLWQVRTWRQTTDPGLPGLINPCRPEGCAIMVPGQWRGCFEGGFHKGDKDRWSLIQVEPLPVYRDNNKDSCLDFDPSTIMFGEFGINIHDPYKDNLEAVGAASLGCQVALRKDDHKEFMDIYDIAAGIWGKRLTYTLLNESDLNG